MSILRIVEGEMINTTTGKMDLRATDGDYTIHAAGKNQWVGGEKGIFEKDYEPLHPEDSLNNTINVSLNIFFDGTQNNKTNTDAKKTDSKDHDAYLKVGNKKDDSFENEYTNVARGYDAIDPEAKFQRALYIEGIGTEDLESDDVFPDVAIGMGYRGVVAKVVKACVKAPESLNKYRRKEIAVLKLNVYGFSRGATAARHFLHITTSPAFIYSQLPDNKVQVLAPGYYQGMEDKNNIITIPNNPLLNRHGFFAACLLNNDFNIKKIEINFVGLYDTVASYGFYHGNDSIDLHLDAVKKARFVLQLSSDDEYRENFDLVNIQSAGLHGLELTLPGVHSDIGGSYINNAKEVSALYYKRESVYNQMIHSSDKEIQKLKEIVISEGWYKKHQIEAGVLHKSAIDDKIKKGSVEDLERFYAVVGTRNLYNTYDQIPLHLMFHFSKDAEVEYDTNYINQNHTIHDEFIKSVSNNLNNYVNACNNLRNNYIEMYNGDLYDKNSINEEYLSKLKRISYLDFIDEEVLKKLRNQYLHWSVKANELGLGSRESQAPAKDGAFEGRYRKREIHNG
ncbi:phospholipase effector Tle1 domain-containing protein [Flavobacterium anhuiense]|uniref:phospholipase effector Tle1 domain-containing protein n=1 Tax=Flavobacterium anhuiense TaxID=459526 RepID=UPI0034D96603